MPYTRPYSGGFVDYPSTTTPINSTALNTMDVGIKTANDQFQTVTTTQRAALTPTVGQCVWDSDLRQLMVFMNASGGNAWQPVGNRIVCASTTRPSSPFEGQEIYETDTNKTYVYTGASWFETADLDNTGGLSDAAYSALPRGYVTGINLTSFSTTSTSYVDVTGLSVTFTAPASRRYQVSLYSAMTNNTANLCQCVINDGTSNIAEGYTMNIANQILTSTIFAITTPAAGSVTYKVRMQVQGGTGEMYGTTTRASLAAKLLVMDIGSA